MKLPYTKKSLTFDEQIVLLQKRNLSFGNVAFAKSKLSHINYYRLSAYFHHFQDENHDFEEDTSFEEVVQLYYFDKKLRNTIFYAMEKIEVYFRTSLAYLLSQKFGSFGYVDAVNMHDAGKHEAILKSIRSEVVRSKEVFVKHFFDTYDGAYLPVWAMVEVISFGTLSRLFGNLKEQEQRSIANTLGLKPLVLARWLHTLTYVRNICAHHARLWNKMLAVRPIKPRRNATFAGLNNTKLFFVLTMILYLLEKIDGDEYGFKQEIKILLQHYPDVKLFNMGFPEDWETILLWKED